MPIAIVQFILGFVLLIAGRRIYWLFVSSVGFLGGLALSTYVLKGQPLWAQLLFALIFGLVGAILATNLQRIALSIAGFFAAGYGMSVLLGILNFDGGTTRWLLILIGGVLGAFFVLGLFNLALIVLTSWGGASLMVEAVGFSGPLALGLLIGLLFIGLLLQGIGRRRESGLSSSSGW